MTINKQKIFRQRKAYVTLLETLIAISILSVVLVFAFGFFRELAEITKQSEIAQKESFQKRYLESRLSYIFQRIVNENRTQKPRRFYFYAQPPNRDYSFSTSLILSFNNDVRRNPYFSGDVLGRLYVDLDHTLRLAIWPLTPEEEPHQHLHEEILLENVADVEYFFYAAPERSQNEKDIQSGKNIDPEKKSPEKDKWHQNEWYYTYDQMPSIVKMVVKVADDPGDLKSRYSSTHVKTTSSTYYFVLPSSKNPVHYWPGAIDL